MTKLTIDNNEQSAFEDWLTRTCPSGDVESVHRQWLGSYDYNALTTGCEMENVGMTKPAIESEELASLLKDYKESDRRNMQYTARNLFAYMAERLAAAYEQGKKDATEWVPVTDITRPSLRAYLVMNNKGQVAPCIDGIIHNVTGSAWDWNYGESVTHYMPMPLPKEPTCGK